MDYWDNLKQNAQWLLFTPAPWSYFGPALTFVE